MIKKLSIKGFKSIRHLDLDCRRVNVFIGEPNTGKTNILEALGLWCSEVVADLATVMRITQFSELFTNQDSETPISVLCDDECLTIAPNKIGGVISLKDSETGKSSHEWRVDQGARLLKKPEGAAPDFYLRSHEVRYYLFNSSINLDDSYYQASLRPPFGSNLGSLLAIDKKVRQQASAFFEGGPYRLFVDVPKRSLVMAREEDGILISFPYSSSSETIRRMAFYYLALDTNSGHTLVFDEPEAHAFPPFTKRLAERIASDDRGNQFFLTTHSPYMLDSLLSKTPARDLNVVLCRMENFETKVYALDEDQIGKLMEWSMDAFFNFDRLIEVPA